MHITFYESNGIKWVRSTTDTDGNCFFHAYLYNIEGDIYDTYPIWKRKEKVLSLKQSFSDKVTVDHALDLIDVEAFEIMQNYLSSHYPQFKLPDLTNLPPLSWRKYILMIYQYYPELSINPSFQSDMYRLQQSYHRMIQENIRRDGKWMEDVYIDLFMKVMNQTIFILSHSTGKKITHIHTPINDQAMFIYHIGNHFESVARKTHTMTRLFAIQEIISLF